MCRLRLPHYFGQTNQLTSAFLYVLSVHKSGGSFLIAVMPSMQWYHCLFSLQCIFLALIAPLIVGVVVCGCTTSESVGFRTSLLCPLPGTKLITEESFMNDVMQSKFILFWPLPHLSNSYFTLCSTCFTKSLLFVWRHLWMIHMHLNSIASHSSPKNIFFKLFEESFFNKCNWLQSISNSL